MNFIMSNLPTIILAAIVAILIIGLLASGYVKAPPNKAYIISGLRKNPKVLIGRAGIKIPFLEQKNDLQHSKESLLKLSTFNYRISILSPLNKL